MKQFEFIFIATLLVLSACDMLSAEGVDFMPLAVGNTWTYEYVHFGRPTSDPPPDSVRGLLTWEVISSREIDDAVRYSVRESFEGRYKEKDWNSETGQWEWSEWEPHSWTREIRIYETRKGLLFDIPFSPRTAPSITPSADWIQDPVPRYYSTSSDTISSVGEADSYAVFDHRWQLVRDQGIVFYGISQRGDGPAGEDEWSLTLVSHELH